MQKGDKHKRENTKSMASESDKGAVAPLPNMPYVHLPSLTKSRHALLVNSTREVWKRGEAHGKESRNLRDEAEIESLRGDAEKKAAVLRLNRAGVREFQIRAPAPAPDLATTDPDFAQAVWNEIVKATGSASEANEFEFYFTEHQLEPREMQLLLNEKDSHEATEKDAREIIQRAYCLGKIVFSAHIEGAEFEFYAPFDTKAEALACLEALKNVDFLGRPVEYNIKVASFGCCDEKTAGLYGKPVQQIVDAFAAWFKRMVEEKKI